jgi:hypothetical protein
MANVKPITPQEALELKQNVIIPDVVFEAFNELIATEFDGSHASIRQDDVVNLILKKMSAAGIDDPQVNYRWLDIEPLYRKAGWQVEYDKPGYNEEGPALFKFTKKKSGS